MFLTSLLNRFCKRSVRVPDNRVMIRNTQQFPWHLVTRVIGDHTDLALQQASVRDGSGFLVGPYCALTSAHLVFDYTAQKYNRIGHVAPGQFYDAGEGLTKWPFGGKVPAIKATNNGYINRGLRKFDYGALMFDSPFNGISTFMPVAFNDMPASFSVCGYPLLDQPNADSHPDRGPWLASGEAMFDEPRLTYHSAKCSRGSDGGPLLAGLSEVGLTRATGIHQGRHPHSPGVGVKFNDRNRRLILNWMTFLPKNSVHLPRLPWRKLVEDRTLLDGSYLDGDLLLNPGLLGLVSRQDDSRENPQPRYRVAQWIENSFYVWDVFEFPDHPGGADSSHERLSRYLGMIFPERKFLSVEEATLLLSASQSWMRAPLLTDQPLNQKNDCPPRKRTADNDPVTAIDSLSHWENHRPGEMSLDHGAFEDEGEFAFAQPLEN